MLKQDDEVGPKIINLLSDSIYTSKLRADLDESLELNKKLMTELERIVKKKVEDEDELFTKFRELLNRYKSA